MPPRKIRSGIAKVIFFRDSSYVAQVLFHVASIFQAFSFLLDCPGGSEVLAEPRGSPDQRHNPSSPQAENFFIASQNRVLPTPKHSSMLSCAAQLTHLRAEFAAPRSGSSSQGWIFGESSARKSRQPFQGRRSSEVRVGCYWDSYL